MNGTDGIESRQPAPDEAPQAVLPNAPQMNPRRKTWLIVIPAILLVFVAANLAWDNLYGASAKRRAEEAQDREQTERYHQYLKDFEDAMRADTYGGSTPEETLQLFISALKQGDIDLASKYFALETNENSPDYLKNKSWKTFLDQLKERGLLETMIRDIDTLAVPDEKDRIDSNDYKFVLKTVDGRVGAIIDMQFNEQSHVWKIQSL